MKFSKDDFQCNRENWKDFLAEFPRNSGLSYLELGVYEGRSFFWVLENVFQTEKDLAVAVDRFQHPESLGVRKTFFQNLELSKKKQQVKVMEMDFRSALVQLALEKQKFDLIYEDGSHMSSETMETLCLAWPLLNVGGILIIDDYGWNKDLPSEFTNSFGIDSFLQMHRQEIQLIRKDHQVVVKRLLDRRFDLDSIEMGDWLYRWHDGVLYHFSLGRELCLSAREKEKMERWFAHEKWKSPKDRLEFIHLVLKDHDLMGFLEQKKQVLLANEVETPANKADLGQ